MGSADIKGFEFELQANPIAALELSANVGLTDFKWRNLGTSDLRKQGARIFGGGLRHQPDQQVHLQSFLDLRAFGEGQMSGQPAEPREWGVTFRKNF